MARGKALSIGQELHLQRTHLGLSLAEVAEGVCSVSYLSLIESGKREPSKNVLARIRLRLGLRDANAERIAILDALDSAEAEFRLGNFEQAEQWLRSAGPGVGATLLSAEIADARGEFELAIRGFTDVSDDVTASPLQRVKALTGKCRVLRDFGEMSAAQSCGESALHEASALGVEAIEAQAELRATLAGVYCETGDIRRAHELLEALDSDASVSEWKRAALEWGKSTVLSTEGKFGESADYARRALSRLRSLDRPRTEANLIQTAAWLELKAGNASKSQIFADLQRAESVLRSVGAPYELAMCLGTIAEADSIFGDAEHARQAISEAVQLTQKLDAGFRARVLADGAMVSLRLGDLAECERLLLESRRLLEGSGAARSAALTWRQLGAIHEALGQVDLALSCLKAATDLVGLGAHVVSPLLTTVNS